MSTKSNEIELSEEFYGYVERRTATGGVLEKRFS